MTSTDLINKISDRWVNDIQESIFSKIDEEVISVLTIEERNVIKEETADGVRQEILNKITEDEIEYNKKKTSILEKSNSWIVDYLSDLDKIVIYNLFDDMTSLVNKVVKEKLLDENKEITLETLRNRVTFNRLIRRGKFDINNLEGVMDKINEVGQEETGLAEQNTETVIEPKQEFVNPKTIEDLDHNEKILLEQGYIKPNSLTSLYDLEYGKDVLFHASGKYSKNLREYQLKYLDRIRKFGPMNKEDGENYNRYFEIIGFEEEKIDIPQQYHKNLRYKKIVRTMLKNKYCLRKSDIIENYFRIAPILHMGMLAVAMKISNGQVLQYMLDHVFLTLVLVITPKIIYDIYRIDYKKIRYELKEGSVSTLFDFNTPDVLSNMEPDRVGYIYNQMELIDRLWETGRYAMICSVAARIILPILVTLFIFVW